MIKIDVNHLEKISNGETEVVRCPQHPRTMNGNGDNNNNSSPSDTSGASLSSRTQGNKESCNIEIEVNQMEDLAIITELDMSLEKPNCNETFAMPKAKHCNAIIR